MREVKRHDIRCRVCGAPKANDGELTCGRCPARLASDAEIMASIEGAYELPSCYACRRFIVTSGNQRNIENSLHIVCYECFRTRQAACEHPLHSVLKCGSRLQPAAFVKQYAWQDSRERSNTFGRILKITACGRCAATLNRGAKTLNSLRMVPWSDYEQANGTIDKATGEVQPIAGHAAPMRLTGHPFDVHGGWRNAWHPPPGTPAIGLWCAFLPSSIAWRDEAVKPPFNRMASPVPFIRAVRYMGSNNGKQLIVNSCISHRGLQTYVETELEKHNAQLPSAVRTKRLEPLGWIFARIVGFSGQRHNLYTSKYRDVDVEYDPSGRSAKPLLSIAEWVSACLEETEERIAISRSECEASDD